MALAGAYVNHKKANSWGVDNLGSFSRDAALGVGTALVGGAAGKMAGQAAKGLRTPLENLDHARYLSRPLGGRIGEITVHPGDMLANSGLGIGGLVPGAYVAQN